MNTTSAKAIKETLRKYALKPSRGLGQNFLVNRYAIAKLLAAAELGPEDMVLEIGPGIGTLTQELAKRAKRVIAVEKDSRLVRMLEGLIVGMKNVEVIHGDILDKTLLLRSSRALSPKYKVVANLPYYITAPVIRKFLEGEKPDFEREKVGLQSMTLIVQKEVAQRMCAKPPNMSMLAVSVQFYATAKIIRPIKKSSFWPQPKVDSAIIHIVPHKEKPAADPKKFFPVVKAGFKQPRKQLKNNLPVQLLRKANINPTQRAETLSVQDWITLANML